MSNKISVSLCMVVKNEDMLIGQCLDSVKSAVDEIIIVDTGSTDKTIEIAKRFGARIFHYKWDGSKGRARNIYITNARCPWILVLDADERIAQKDLTILQKLVKNTKVSGYVFTRRDYTKYDLLRQWQPNNGKYPEEELFSCCPGWSSTEYLRLFQKQKGIYYKEELSAHTDAINFSQKPAVVKKCSGVVIHHFQYLRGEKFVEKKQADYLKNEIKYIRIFHTNPWVYLNIGITLFARKKDRQAIKYLKKALKLKPEFDMACLILGMVYKEMASFKKAVFYLGKAIDISPEYADAWALLGMVYVNLGRMKDAQKYLKNAVKLHPFHVLAHNSLGIAYESQNKLEEAEKEYKKAIQYHPQFTDAHYNLGTLYVSQNRHTDAQNCYRRILEINPKDKIILTKLKNLLIRAPLQKNVEKNPGHQQIANDYSN